MNDTTALDPDRDRQNPIRPVGVYVRLMFPAFQSLLDCVNWQDIDGEDEDGIEEWQQTQRA